MDTIKETVKNIFKSNTFEDALELTRTLRGEYIREFGVKSWNGLVTYYKKANIIPEVSIASEPESDAISEEVSEAEIGSLAEVLPLVNDNDVSDTDASENDSAEPESEIKHQVEEERVEYMLYQNDGDKVDWYGHFVNYKGLKVGDCDMMIRMNNLGIGMGKVLATASMTMDEIAMFHRCYAAIRTSTSSDSKRVILFKRAFNNLQDAMKDPAFATKSTKKAIVDFVLNFSDND